LNGKQAITKWWTFTWRKRTSQQLNLGYLVNLIRKPSRNIREGFFIF